MGLTVRTAWVDYNQSKLFSMTAWCIAVKSSVPQGMFVCFNKEVVWRVGIAVILRGVGRV
jgi:hypothetical protein